MIIRIRKLFVHFQMYNVEVLVVKANLAGVSYIKAGWQLQASTKIQEP